MNENRGKRKISILPLPCMKIIRYHVYIEAGVGHLLHLPVYGTLHLWLGVRDLASTIELLLQALYAFLDLLPVHHQFKEEFCVADLIKTRFPDLGTLF